MRVMAEAGQVGTASSAASDPVPPAISTLAHQIPAPLVPLHRHTQRGDKHLVTTAMCDSLTQARIEINGARTRPKRVSQPS